MTDKKLTDNEIIKAYEHCLNNKDCIGCIADKHPSSDKFSCSLEAQDILDLITRLQTRAEKAEKVEYFADKTIATLQAENKDLTETIHNLIIEKDALFDRAEELKAEVNKLNAENMLTMSERNAFRNSFYELSKQLKTAKSEAVKEFAERVKKEAVTRLYYGTNLELEETECVEVEDIDNLLKETVGDN